jgi:VanZ family protein
LVVLYAGVIFYISSVARLGVEYGILAPYDPHSVSLHILEYIPFGFLLINASTKKYPSFGFGFLYGLSDEFHQYYVPGRFVSWVDVVANGIGVFLGVSIYLLINKKENNHVS